MGRDSGDRGMKVLIFYVPFAGCGIGPHFLFLCPGCLSAWRAPYASDLARFMAEHRCGEMKAEPMNSLAEKLHELAEVKP
jgi:hypothetical protein